MFNRISVGLVLFAASTCAEAQAMVRATPMLTVGDSLAGSTVMALNPVFTDGNGRPGSLVVLASGARLIWSDGAVLFNSSTVGSPVLVGSEAAIGFGDGGRFAYSPSADGNDAIYTQNGVLLAETQAIPGQIGLFSSFNSRPGMLPDGRAFWVGGYTSTSGGATEGRILLRASTAGPSVFEGLLRSGDLIGGFAVNTVGIGFGVAMSDNGNQLATLLILDTGSTANDNVVRVNNLVVAREGDPVASAPGENWQGFAGTAINNAGRWLLAGDTSGAAASDAFLASDGVLQVREGSTYDGEALVSPAAVRAASINNRNEVIHVWNTEGNVRKAFFAPDGSRLDLSRLLLRTGSPLDLDGNGSADATLVDILGTFTSVFAVNLAEDGFVYFHASYNDGVATRESLLRISLDGIFANGFEN